MRWLKRRAGLSVLAMLALAAQMFASVGHTHASRYTGEATLALKCRTLVPSGDKGCPPRHNSKHCPICLSMDVVAGADVGDVPQLAGPSLTAGYQALPPPSQGVGRSTAAVFEARAPPAAA